MTKRNIPSDTTTFTYYNNNPKGKIASDCVIRAISLATNKDYNEVVDDLVNMMKKTGYIIDERKCYGKYLKQLGWIKIKQPKKIDNTKYTGSEFCQIFIDSQNNDFDTSRIIAHIGGHHIVAIINKKIYDIWNCTGQCIGNYWIKNK
jgi:hypothetical protein